MQRLIVLSLASVLTFPGCSAAKSLFGTPVRQEAVSRMCQDGLKDLEQIHGLLMHEVTDPAQVARLQHLHETVKMALTNCVTTGQGTP